MNIATVTCHDVYNYGASLQSYALQEYCKASGHNYEIIDYKPDYLSNHYRLGVVANPKFDRPILRELYLLAKLYPRLVALRKKKKFDKFTQEYLNTSAARYSSNEDLKKYNPDTDLFIAGSDQIWNTLFKNGHDAAFYLDFARNRGRRISYAASFATDAIYGGAEHFVSEQLKNFDAVSVRESSALTLLEKLGINDGILVCDPVFLLSSDKWRQLIQHQEIPQDDYILVYDCEKSPKLKDISLTLKYTTGLPIYSLSATNGHYADKDFSLGGPLDFLRLIAGARYVIANSFHALAFSLIFHKDFFIVNRSENINTRMRDFLQYLGLSHRLIDTHDGLTVEPVDFEKPQAQLDGLIYNSRQFIETQIRLCL